MATQHFVRRFLVPTLFCFYSALVLQGCGSDAEPSPNGNEGGSGNEAGSGNEGGSGPNTTSIEIEGTWDSNFGGEETISAETWGRDTLVSFDNEENTAITQTAADSEFNPDKFNKVVWTELEGDAFYYCLADYGLDTAELARSSTKTVDDSDPETTGCGDFSWTKLTRAAP